MHAWVIPVASLLLGAGGVGTIAGLFVQHQNNKATQSAVGVSQVVDGLTKLSERQAAELARQDALLAQKDERIAELEAALTRRRGTK